MRLSRAMPDSIAGLVYTQPVIEARLDTELQEVLSQAETFFVPKGRLNSICMLYLGRLGVSTPAMPNTTGEMQNEAGQTFFIVPDAAIRNFVLDAPGAFGLTGTHQLAENYEIPSNWYHTQVVLTLQQSRYALVTREENLHNFRKNMENRDWLSIYSEYPKTTEAILSAQNVNAKIVHVRSGCSEIMLRLPNDSADGALVITETEETLRSCSLAIGMDHLAPVEISAFAKLF